jgi:hypothetical protein
MAVINEYLRGQLEAISGFWVSNCDAVGAPDLVRTMGVRAEPDGQHLVAFVPVPYARNLVAQLVPGGKLTLLHVNVNTYVSYQFKGHCVWHRPSTADEIDFQRHYMGDFCREIEKHGMVWETTFPVLFRQPSLTLLMRAAEVYEQTPKAGTGERVFF